MLDSSLRDLNAARTSGFDKSRGFVVRMRGLPFNGSSSDVLRFFDGIDVVRGMEGVVFTYAQVWPCRGPCVAPPCVTPPCTRVPATEVEGNPLARGTADGCAHLCAGVACDWRGCTRTFSGFPSVRWCLDTRTALVFHALGVECVQVQACLACCCISLLH